MAGSDDLKKIPSSIEAEKAVLCSIFLRPDKFDEVLEIVKPEDFYKRAHQDIFGAMIDIFSDTNDRDGVVIDETLVIEKLKENGKYEESGGEETLYDILENVPTAANILSYARIVKDKSVLRKLGDVGTKIVEMVYDEYEEVKTVLDKAESMIFKVAENKDAKDVIPIREAMGNEMIRLDKIYKNKGHTGISSGYVDFDAKTSGFHPSDLVILAARPSMGKTALALNFALNVAMKEKKTVLIFSLEMSEAQLSERFLAIDAAVPLQKIRSGFLDDKDLGMIGTSVGRLAGTDLIIADTPSVNVLEIRTIARRLKARGSLDMIVIDYLQLIRGSSSRYSDNRQQEISDISRSLKSIARELDIPVVALSQLSRAVESRSDRRPMLSDLRESGAIEQDADVVMFLYRDEYYNEDSQDKGITEVIIGKQRNGPTGTVKLRFFNEYTRFENYTNKVD